jgi:ADP-ribosylglycohydrolase
MACSVAAELRRYGEVDADRPAARHLDDYPAGMTACVRAGGDVDTTCAIAGGVIAARTGAVPAEKLRTSAADVPRKLTCLRR